jgi:hypothetical protein
MVCLGSFGQLQVPSDNNMLAADDVRMLVQSSPNPDVSQYVAGGEDDEDPDENVEKVWYTPPISYTGQTFATKEEVKSYYDSMLMQRELVSQFELVIHISQVRRGSSAN